MKIIIVISAILGLGLTKLPGYRYDQTLTGNRCVSDYQCDGTRVCSVYGYCSEVGTNYYGNPQNTIYPSINQPRRQKNSAYMYDEGPNGNRCNNDYECAGRRTCSQWNWCQGVH